MSERLSALPIDASPSEITTPSPEQLARLNTLVDVMFSGEVSGHTKFSPEDPRGGKTDEVDTYTTNAGLRVVRYAWKNERAVNPDKLAITTNITTALDAGSKHDANRLGVSLNLMIQDGQPFSASYRDFTEPYENFDASKDITQPQLEKVLTLLELAIDEVSR